MESTDCRGTPPTNCSGLHPSMWSTLEQGALSCEGDREHGGPLLTSRQAGLSWRSLPRPGLPDAPSPSDDGAPAGGSLPPRRHGSQGRQAEPVRATELSCPAPLVDSGEVASGGQRPGLPDAPCPSDGGLPAGGSPPPRRLGSQGRPADPVTGAELACPAPLVDSGEVASLKLWLSAWASRLEECLKSHQATLDRSGGRPSAWGPAHEASLASISTLFEIRLAEQLSSQEDRMARRLEEHVAQVERLLLEDGRSQSKQSIAEPGLREPSAEDGRGARAREPLRGDRPAGVPDSHRAYHVPGLSGAGSVQGSAQGSPGLEAGRSRPEDGWDRAMRQTYDKRDASHAMALVSSLGWLNGEKPMLEKSSTVPLSSLAKFVKDVAEPVRCANTIQRYISILSFALILLDTVYMGMRASMRLACRRDGQAIPIYLGHMDVTFAILFLVDIVVRVYVYRCQFFIGPGARWNAFDCVLALTPLFEFVNLRILRSFRALRAVRAARMIRAVTFVQDLRLMVESMLGSLQSLMWAFCLLGFVIYIFSVFLMQSVELDAADADLTPGGLLMESYGTLSDSMYTLFCAISGGKDWDDLLLPLDGIGKGYRLVLVGYVVFVSFGVLNVLTATFVERTLHGAEIDRENVLREGVAQDKSTMNEIRRMFKAADGDGDGRLSRRELERVLQEEDLTKHLRVLKLDVNEVVGLFQLLDVDDQERVMIDEFVIQLMRVRGGASRLDLQTMLYENKRIFLRLTAMMKFVEKHLCSLEAAMDRRAHRHSGARE